MQWRGPLNTGMAPGQGHSTPVIAGDRIFMTTAIPTGAAAASGRMRGGGGNADAGIEHSFDVLAIDRNSGKTLWQRTATVATPHDGYHRSDGSFASNSPVTDGTLILKKDFGVRMRMDNGWGEGTPLTLHDNRLLLHFDHLDGGFLTMLDPATGKEIWRWRERSATTGPRPSSPRTTAAARSAGAVRVRISLRQHDVEHTMV
jgi:hypothetical protein